MIVIEPFAAGLSAPAEYAHIHIKLILIFLAFGILAGRAVYPESNLWTYLTPVGLGLILLMVHVFMPQLAGLPKDNPKIKTMRRINLLTMGVILGLFLAHRFVPEKVYEDKNRFLLPFSVAVVLFVGNAAPKIPVNPVMGIRLPWTRRDPDTWRGADSFRIFLYLPLQIKLIAASAKENGFNQKEQIPRNKQAVMGKFGVTFFP